jgi:excisionase family DNA binding protein
MSNEITIATPNTPEITLAGESFRRLSQSNLGDESGFRIRIGEGDGAAEATIPASVFRIMMHSLSEMARGHAVALIPTDALLTTKQAADLLNVAVSSFDKLLDRGEIPFKKLAGSRAVRFEDVMTFKRADDEKRSKLLEELTAEAQELGLGY